MPPTWDDPEPTEVSWSDPDAWRGDRHPEESASWLGESLPFSLADEPDPMVLEDDLLAEDDWCPGGWLDEWGDN